MAVSQSLAAVMVGRAFDTVVNGATFSQIRRAALRVVAAYVGYGVFDIVNSMAIRVLAQRVERDARDELYLSLLGKSQTFHGRQRVGDLMARVTNDVQQVNQFVSPALGMTTESVLTLIIPLITIATLNSNLLLVPVVFLVCFSVALAALQQHSAAGGRRAARALRHDERRAGRDDHRDRGGQRLCAGAGGGAALHENARGYRDTFVREGEVTARYLPLLVYGIAVGLAFGMRCCSSARARITVGQVITFMALFGTLRSPMCFLLTTSSVVQQSLASATRILT